MRQGTRLLLALCGIAEGICAATNLLMLDPDGSAVLLSALALVAGACAVAIGLWNAGRGASWLLSLHGVALGAFGAIGISPLVRSPLSFRPISLLFVVTALSVGAFALRRRDGWLPGVWGAAAIGFACSFVVIGFNWVRLEPPQSYWIWMASYFGFCAAFMFWLASRRFAHARAAGSEV